MSEQFCTLCSEYRDGGEDPYMILGVAPFPIFWKIHIATEEEHLGLEHVR